MSQITALAGVLCILTAIALLTDARWALLAAGVVLVLSAWAQHTSARATPQQGKVAPAHPKKEPA